MLAAARAPAALGRLQRRQRGLRERLHERRLDRGAEGLGDRVPRAVADLQQALPRRAAALGEAIAAVLARELDAALLEPMDGAGRLARQHLDEPPVGGLVARPPHILGVLLAPLALA